MVQGVPASSRISGRWSFSACSVSWPCTCRSARAVVGQRVAERHGAVVRVGRRQRGPAAAQACSGGAGVGDGERLRRGDRKGRRRSSRGSRSGRSPPAPAAARCGELEAPARRAAAPGSAGGVERSSGVAARATPITGGGMVTFAAAARPGRGRARLAGGDVGVEQRLRDRRRQLPLARRDPDVAERGRRARWAANSGTSRPVGSNVNQPGQPCTATGVTGPTPRLSSRQTKTPRCGMACQPNRPSPAPRVGGVEELVERRARLAGAVDVAQVREAADVRAGQRSDQPLGLVQRRSSWLPGVPIGPIGGSSPWRVRPSRRKNSTTLASQPVMSCAICSSSPTRALAAAVVDGVGDVEPLAARVEALAPGGCRAARRCRGSPSRRRSRSTGPPTAGRCSRRSTAAVAPMRLTISRSGPLAPNWSVSSVAVDRRQQVPQLVGVVDRVVVAGGVGHDATVPLRTTWVVSFGTMK